MLTMMEQQQPWLQRAHGRQQLMEHLLKVYLRPGELTFDTQGNLVSPIQKVGYKGDFAADDATGAAALSIDLDLNFDGSTQFASDFNVKSVTQDGQTVGKLDGLNVAANGLVSANYTNGLNIALGRLVMVNFNNQNGLKQIGNATYVETSSFWCCRCWRSWS